MTVVLQKAVPPAVVAAYLTQGYDRVSGYVVRAAEVSAVTAIAELRRLHLVEHEGSLHATTGPLHILHVDRSPSWQLLPATAANVTERDVLPTSGTVEVDEQLVEVFLLDHTRLTSGARLWRFEDGAEPVLVGTYLGPAFGWQDHTRDDALKAAVPTPTCGAVVILAERPWVADVVCDDDGAPTAITAVSAAEPPAELGFARNVHGIWVRAVDHAAATALFELRVGGTWRGLPVQVVQHFRLPDGRTAMRVCSLARNWEKARDLGFIEVELGAWEATVAAGEVQDTVPQEIAAQQWMTGFQRERLAKLEQAARSNTVRTAPAGGNVHTEGFAPDVPVTPTATPSPSPASSVSRPGTGLDDAAHRALYERIAKGTLPHVPKGITEVQILCEAVGNVMELGSQAILTDGSPVPVPTVSEDVARALGELRALGPASGEGPWFGALVTITATGQFSVRFNRDERPRMKREITPEMLRVERQRFPRATFPQWFTDLEAAAGS